MSRRSLAKRRRRNPLHAAPMLYVAGGAAAGAAAGAVTSNLMFPNQTVAPGAYYGLGAGALAGLLLYVWSRR